jgi:hypothetical protein
MNTFLVSAIAPSHPFMTHDATSRPAAPTAIDKLIVRDIDTNRPQPPQNDRAYAFPVLNADQGNLLVDVGRHHDLNGDFLFCLLVL